MNYFLDGAIAISCIVAFMFFIRFWQKTKDSFFQIFSLAFLMFAIERIFLATINPESEIKPYIYIVRLIAFLIIILAIVDKNIREKQK